jgi:hypothetical protein
VELGLQGGNALPLSAIEPNGVANGMGWLWSRHGNTITHCTLQ